jgi:hypothetical protein
MKGALTRYAIYTRQSSYDAGKVLSSCEAQFSICQDFVKSRAAPHCKWIGECNWGRIFTVDMKEGFGEAACTSRATRVEFGNPPRKAVE